ncbi:MAG: HD family phosphohydrolase [Chloroflexota bacterium]
MDAAPAPRSSARIFTLRLILLAAVSVVTFAALALPVSLRPAALPLEAGDVAPRDLQAPSGLTFESAVLTEQRRELAANNVPPVYAPPDLSISRRQVDELRAVLRSIATIRGDAETTRDQKAAALASLPDLSLTPETIQQILALSPSRWDQIEAEALSVLEGIMRGAIREDDLESARRGVTARVSLSLSEEQAALVAELVAAFIVPNSLYNAEATEAARDAAREQVPPVSQSFKAGEVIVRAGEVISEADIEALEKFGLIQSEPSPQDYLGAASLTLLSVAFVSLYFLRRKRLGFLYDSRSLLVVAVVFLVFLIGARLSIPGRVVVPYLYPLPAVGLLLTALFGIEAGLVVSLAVCVLAAYGLSADLTPYYLMASLCGVLTLGPARRFWSFVTAGLAVALAGMAAILAFRLPFTSTDLVGILTLLSAALFNGLASSSLALLGQYFLAQALGLTTSLQLLEISRPDFPLLQYFLRNAPGTYQHSLQVANLAEQAAENIGADPLLTRVGALFHDVGKARNPSFFIENQAPGQVDTHNDLDPLEVAETIIRHVTDGVHLARKHRLPRRIDDFILEHHGTMHTRYQYSQAVEQAGGDASKVDINLFRYPGPRPRSRETALLMLADGAEARARAERPADEEGLRAIVRSVIEIAQLEGQLDQTALTLRDLGAITESFVTTLRGTYHPRIQYPAAKAVISKESQTVPLKKKET